jgi:menaquinone-dependent protoporphyrinogen oxidase
MTAPVLVAYATRRGSTREVADAVAARLRELGHTVEVRPADHVEDVARYGAVVLGGALYTGRLHRDARAFLRRHRAALAERPLAVFALGPLTLSEQDVADSRRQLDRALARVPALEPVAVAIFGGVVDPGKLPFPFSTMRPSDARDWDAIEAWATGVAGSLSPRAPGRSRPGTARAARTAG